MEASVYPQRLQATGHNSKTVDLFSFGVYLVFLSVGILSVSTFDERIQLILYLMSVFMYLMIFTLEVSISPSRNLSFYLFVPSLLSATQNLYLGYVAESASSSQVQIMVITNFILVVGMVSVLIFLLKPKDKFFTAAMTILIVLAAFSIGSIFLFQGHFMSAIASMRNIITPPLLLVLGFIAYRRSGIRTVLIYIAVLSVFVVAFGFYERYMETDIWLRLNLTELLIKKGLPVHPSLGVPLNFYSSELLNGEHVRRMVSSFADPVNLGTFLFFSFMSAWYLRRKLLMLIISITIVLALSKGALLGILVFSAVFAYYFAKKSTFVLVVIGAALAGIGFVLYSLSHSTMSLFLHVEGFLAAFKELPSHPLGRGVGNIGVLAGLYSNGAETGITESGIGMIIGQLGVMGLILYYLLFKNIYSRLVRCDDKRTKAFALSLLFSIILNIMFNEVALSPNSSAIYFVALGLICASIRSGRRQEALPQASR